MLAGSALKNKGMQPILDAVVDYLPSPLDVPPVTGTDPKTGECYRAPRKRRRAVRSARVQDRDRPVCRQLTFFRVYSGTLTAGSYIYNANKDKKERIGRILRMHADNREEIDQVFAGEIAAAVGLKDTKTWRHAL